MHQNEQETVDILPSVVATMQSFLLLLRRFKVGDVKRSGLGQ